MTACTWLYPRIMYKRVNRFYPDHYSHDIQSTLIHVTWHVFFFPLIIMSVIVIFYHLLLLTGDIMHRLYRRHNFFFSFLVSLVPQLSRQHLPWPLYFDFFSLLRLTLLYVWSKSYWIFFSELFTHLQFKSFHVIVVQLISGRYSVPVVSPDLLCPRGW